MCEGLLSTRGETTVIDEMNVDGVSTAEASEALAAAWELAAFSFRYPTEELAQAVASGEWADAAREVAQALGLELPEGFGVDAGVADLSALRVEATRLFVGSPQPVASPYEGVMRANEDGVQALLFVNPHSMAVERFMKSCGLTRPDGTNEPLDHVATECELLEHLALRSLGIAMDEASSLPADENLPGGSSRAAYEAFLAEHARVWMPGFAASVSVEARLPFYRDAATLLSALVE